MFIQTENTPNPETIKFIPGQVVMESGTAEFLSIDESASSPLAKQLFSVSGVKSVFLASDFVSITKQNDQLWEILKPRVLATIMDHYMSGMPVIDMDAYNNKMQNLKDKKEDLYGEIEKQIIEVLDARIRPAVAQDGGDVEFERFEDGIVYLRMKGACAGCPSATATLKMGIENMLKHFVPEVEEVQAIEL